MQKRVTEMFADRCQKVTGRQQSQQPGVSIWVPDVAIQVLEQARDPLNPVMVAHANDPNASIQRKWVPCHV